ncbi:MAG: hypothetical protein ABI726_04700 [bacterium]
MAAPEESAGFRRRKPSRLALQLADAFAPLDEWSEVKVVRNEFGRRNLVVAQTPAAGSKPHPYDWSAAA